MKKSCILVALLSTSSSSALAPNTARSRNAKSFASPLTKLQYVDELQERVHRVDSYYPQLQVPILSTAALLQNTRQRNALVQKPVPTVPPTLQPTVPPQQPSSTPTKPSDQTLIRLSCLLAANSGFLNGLTLAGVLGSSASVTAVTGTWTKSAVSLATGDTALFATQITLLLAYFCGSFGNGLVHPQGVQWETSTGKALLCMASLVLAGTLKSSLPLLAMANGWQNSWTSMILKGQALRTAHFSGITSDLGTQLGQVLRLRRSPENTDALKTKIVTQSKLLASFFAGGILSVVCRRTVAARTGFLASVVLYVGLYASMALRRRRTVTEYDGSSQLLAYKTN